MPSTNPDDYTIDILKEEYSALRTEIVQSISKQHQITLSGYGLTAVLVGYVLQANNQPWEMFVVIPFILIAMTSLWTVECNRMVRASYYIGYILWPSLKTLANIPDGLG